MMAYHARLLAPLQNLMGLAPIWFRCFAVPGVGLFDTPAAVEARDAAQSTRARARLMKYARFRIAACLC
jgi:hypothetical protein